MTSDQSTRRSPTRDERQASAYLQVRRKDGTAIVSRDEAKAMTPREIIETFERRVDWHHIVERAIGGTMHPTNLDPLDRAEHKTIPSTSRVAKTRRIEKEQAEFRRRLLAKDRGERLPPPAKTKRGNRPMPGSRGSKFKRTMDGRTVLR